MTQADSSEWTALTPRLRSSASRAAFVEFAKELLRIRKAGDEEGATEEASVAFEASARSSGYVDRQALLAAGLVLRDLVVQGWQVRVRSSAVEAQPPVETDSDHAGEKARIRRQELVKRDAQLRQPAVQKFVQSMERTRICDGTFVSIFSLMRDGRELASALKQARKAENDSALVPVVDPYLQFVTSETETCPLTGLRLMDVWRYFRHTWTNQYTSVPGRTMMLLVRDRAARFHPVVGIAAISSPVMQIRERDTWVGWHPDPNAAESPYARRLTPDTASNRVAAGSHVALSSSPLPAIRVPSPDTRVFGSRQRPAMPSADGIPSQPLSSFQPRRRPRHGKRAV